MEQELELLLQEAAGIVNTTAYFMNLAEKYIEQGNTELAKACLILLCKKCINYEDSLEWNGLMDSWLKHRHLVEGLVKPSSRFPSVKPLRPQECTMQIQDIFSLPGDNILLSLSDHLRELSANGSCINCLNKWERTVFYADELWAEVNSGGFDSYLNYHGQHFEKAYQAFEAIEACPLISLMDKIKSKFPRSRMPKTIDALQNALDLLEEKGIDFEAEDSWFYDEGEQEMHTYLLRYVLANRAHFR